MKHCLVLVNGPASGATVDLSQDGAPVTIGRDASRDFPLDDHLASRLHARVWFDGRAWQIEDCGSHNGTTINSRAISRSVLEPGDLIRIGDRLIIFLGEADEPDAWNLRPSVVAASTSVVRIPSPNKRAELLEKLRADTSSRPIRLLSVLYRLSTTLYAQPDVERLARLATETLHEAIDAETVNLWLAGVDGRLRRHGGAGAAKARAGDVHLLASIAVENDEAMLIGLHEPADGRNGAEADRSAIAVPIPVRQRPRGAIECFRSATDSRFDRDDLEFAVAVAHQFGMAMENLEHRLELEQANEQLRARLAAQTRLQGNSPKIRELLDQIARVAPTASTVLILGDSGTGKELVSQMIHELSHRSAGPFVAVNCAAFSESLLESELFGHEPGAFTGAQQRRSGQFERAHRGTIFLDEIGETSPACQAKLLRLMEGHPFERLGGVEPIRVDVRIVAATHRNLPELIKAGRFREDLYYRLRVIELCVPSLHERGKDVMQLAVHFLQQYRREIGRGPRRFSPQAAEAIANHDWPGNVRELKNAIERAVVLGHGEEVTVEGLGLPRRDDDATAGESQLVSLEEAQQRYIRAVLHSVDGNKTQACKILRIGRGTLYKKLDR